MTVLLHAATCSRKSDLGSLEEGWPLWGIGIHSDKQKQKLRQMKRAKGGRKLHLADRT